MRVTVMGTLLVIVLLGIASTAVTHWLLSFRVHDYAILNLAGQLGELATGMADDGRHVLGDPQTAPQPAELDRFRDKLLVSAARYERIAQSFSRRELAPDLTGLDAPVTCNWDAPSLAQLKASVVVWQQVSEGIAPALRATASPGQIEAAARTLDRQGQDLLASSQQLAVVFKDMMQAKLDDVIRMQVISLVVTVSAGLLLLGWIGRRVVRPLAQLESAAARVMDGELGHQAQVRGGDEIQDISAALNRLSARMQLLFDLAESAGGGLSTAELLDAVYRAMSPVLPIDAVGIAKPSSGNEPRWRVLCSAGTAGELFAAGTDLTSGAEAAAVAAISARANTGGLASVVVVSIGSNGPDAAVIFFGTRAGGSFPAPAQALLRSVASIVRSQLDRTLSAEALVVAAVEGLAKLAESRDPETGEHLVRMSEYSALIAAEMRNDARYTEQIGPRFIEDLRRFAPMHDIGKVGIADAILLKPGKLTDDERQAMTKHPTIGAEVLRRCEAQMEARGRSVFSMGIEIAQAHHEKWDGSGYPQGLAGEAIPLSARLVALADVFDALTSRRPYKEAWSIERALATIDSDSGRHFDPAAVAALKRCLPKVLAFYDVHKHT